MNLIRQLHHVFVFPYPLNEKATWNYNCSNPLKNIFLQQLKLHPTTTKHDLIFSKSVIPMILFTY